MIRVEIVRVTGTETETRGVLCVDGDLLASTLELPWRENKKDISCIPEGVYLMERFKESRFGYELFKLRDVPGRSDIEIHIGNYLKDTTGCILIGAGWTRFNGQHALTHSAKTFHEFMKRLSGVDCAELSVFSTFTCSGAIKQ